MTRASGSFTLSQLGLARRGLGFEVQVDLGKAFRASIGRQDSTKSAADANPDRYPDLNGHNGLQDSFCSTPRPAVSFCTSTLRLTPPTEPV